MKCSVIFLSGETVEFDLFQEAKIYNLKREICDYVDEHFGDEQNDCDIQRVHLFVSPEEESQNYEQVEPEQMYRVFIDCIEKRLIYLRDNNVYHTDLPEKREEIMLTQDDMNSLCETPTLQYYFDLESFLRGYTFFREHESYEPYTSLYLSEDEYESDEEDQFENHIEDYLRYVFPKIQTFQDI